MTTETDRALLLRVARNAIAAHVAGGSSSAVGQSDVLSKLGGVFVSVHRHGDLRGCIGHIAADLRLDQVVAQCAVAACTQDPRFAPVTSAELGEIDIELSLLGPLEAIGGPNDIEIGRHGLLVEQDRRRGLLLPQVATEWKWDAVTFLSQVCRKAGLPADAWKRADHLWRFEAEVFGETSF